MGREACRDRVPPTGRDGEEEKEEEEEEEGEVIKLMVRGGGQSLCGVDGEMDAGGRREEVEAWDGLEAGRLVSN